MKILPDIETFTDQNTKQQPASKKKVSAENMITLKIVHEVQYGFLSVTQSEVDQHCNNSNLNSLNQSKSSSNSDNQSIRISTSGLIYPSLNQESLDKNFPKTTYDEKVVNKQIIAEIIDEIKQNYINKDINQQNGRKDVVMASQVIDDEFLQLLQNNEDEDQEEQKISQLKQKKTQESQQDQKNQFKDSIEDSSYSLNKQSIKQGNKDANNQQLSTPPIGYGINNSLNQNELRQSRHQQQNVANGSIPSQQDLLDMIDSRQKTPANSSSVQNSNETEFAIPKQQHPSNIIQKQNEEEQTINIHQNIKKKPLDSLPLQSQAVNADQFYNSQFDEEEDLDHDQQQQEDNDLDFNDYNNWVENMKKSDYDIYMAWFNVNIKQQGANKESEFFFTEDHDFSIKIEESDVVYKLRATAERRMKNNQQQNIEEEVKKDQQLYQQATPDQFEDEFIQKEQNLSKLPPIKPRKQSSFKGSGDELISSDLLKKQALNLKQKQEVFKGIKITSEQDDQQVQVEQNIGEHQQQHQQQQLQRTVFNSSGGQLEQHRTMAPRADNNYDKKRQRPESLEEQNKKSDQEREYKKVKLNADANSNQIKMNKNNKNKRFTGFQ